MVVLILGAGSDIAFALARKFAGANHAHIILASRNMPLLEDRAKDLAIRYGVAAEAVPFDAVDYGSHAGFYHRLDCKPDVVAVAFGHMVEQENAQARFDEIRRTVETNLLGAMSILEIVAADFEDRGHGTIIGVSSVAGERGRKKNYIYGAAKAGFTAFLSGLRNRLCSRGVRVMTVLPGFVRTKMTDTMDLPAPLTAEPEEAAADIHRAFEKKRDIVYTKPLWRWIMLVIRHIPESLFKRLNL